MPGAPSPVGEEDTARRSRRPRRSSALKTRLRAAHAGIDERHLVAMLLADARGRWRRSSTQSGSRPSSGERRLQPAARRYAPTTSTRVRPARTAEPRAWVKLLGVDRLGHRPLAGQRLAPRVDRDEDDLDVRRSSGSARTALEHVEAAHARHQDVERHRVEALCASGDRAPRHLEWAIVVSTSYGSRLHRDQLGDVGLVVNHEHLAAAQSLRAAAARPLGAAGAGILTVKARALVRLALRPWIVPPCRSTSDFHDRQAEARPPGTVWPVGPAIEAVEDVLLLLLGHAAPGVGLLVMTIACSFGLEPYGDPSLLRGGVEVGVRDQVRLRSGASGPDRRAPAAAPAAAAGRAPGDLSAMRGSYQGRHLAHGLDHVGGRAMDLELPGLDARDVEQVAHQVHQPVGREQNHFDELALACRRAPSDRPRSSTKPLIEVSGLRSSCEAVATNSVFIRSSRARSEMSRIVHTITPRPPSGAAVTASDPVVACRVNTSPRERVLPLGQRRRGALRLRAGLECGHELACAGVDVRRRCRRSRTTTRASPRLSIVTASRRRPVKALVCGVELAGHRVERLGEVPELARAGRLDAAVEVPLGELPGGPRPVVEWAAASTQRAARSARPLRSARLSPKTIAVITESLGVVVGLVARLLAPRLLASGEVAA